MRFGEKEKPNSLVYFKIAGKTTENAPIVSMIFDEEKRKPVAVVKTPRNPDYVEGILREYQVMKDLEHSISDINVLSCIAYHCELEIVEGLPIFIQEAKTGSSMVPMVKSKKNIIKLYKRILPWMLKFHMSTAEKHVLDGEILDRLVEIPIGDFLKKYGAMSSGVVSKRSFEYLKKLSKIIKGRSICLCSQHMDFNAHNILIDQKCKKHFGFSLIDWEDYSPMQLPVHDLNHFFYIKFSSFDERCFTSKFI